MPMIDSGSQMCIRVELMRMTGHAKVSCSPAKSCFSLLSEDWLAILRVRFFTILFHLLGPTQAGMTVFGANKSYSSLCSSLPDLIRPFHLFVWTEFDCSIWPLFQFVLMNFGHCRGNAIS